MKKIILLPIVLLVCGFFTTNVSALPAKIVSGQILFGGTSYGTNDYQSYIRFSLNAQTIVPRRDFVMSAVQPYSVYLNHPIQPKGVYDYRVTMPYGPQSLSLNGESLFPVWYEDCVWNIKSSIMTPVATADSPQLVVVNAPFTMSGNNVTFGVYSTGFKFRGNGTVSIRFEKIGTKYYFLEALYDFGENPLLNKE